MELSPDLGGAVGRKHRDQDLAHARSSAMEGVCVNVYLTPISLPTHKMQRPPACRKLLRGRYLPSFEGTWTNCRST